MPKRISLIIGIVLGIIAIFLTHQYISRQRQLAVRTAEERLAQIQKDLVSVIVAKSDISPGAVIEAKDLEMKSVPTKALQPNVAVSLERVIGMMTVVPIAKGEQILLSKLTTAERVTSLATATPTGKRAITISVDSISSLGGMIRAGDYVDVIGVLPLPMTVEGKQVLQQSVIPLFQNVFVLAIGTQLAGPLVPSRREPPREPSPLITLALSPQEASLIAFVAELGKIRLILRSPTDSQISPIIPANFETLFQYLYPETQVREEEKEIPKEKIEKEVEIYRGLQREVIPLKK